MLLVQFFAQNLHFVISLLAAMSMFAVFWLVFDAWTVRRELKELFKWVGFLLLAVGFLLFAAVIEQDVFGKAPLGDEVELVSKFLRLMGYLAVIIGQIIDPLQPKPKSEGLQLEKPEIPEPPAPSPLPMAALGVIGKISWRVALPASSFFVAVLYWRRSHKGLEKHLRPVAISFMLLSFFELSVLAALWQDTTNPSIYMWVAPFGRLWIVSRLFLFAGSVWLTTWVWRYLVKRFQSQLFMVFIGLGVAIFAVTTISFTYLLMRNVEREAFTNLNTAAQVLDYALDSKNAEIQASAEALAQNSEMAAATGARDRQVITVLLGTSLADKQLSSLVVTSDSGQVLVRAENTDKWGESISDDPLVRRALLGEASAGVVSRDDVIAPIVALRSAVPVRDANKVITGVVVTERVIDNAFVDGIKKATGLDSSVYGDNIRASTTLLASDGTSRWIGVKENDTMIRQTVLEQGKNYKGSLSILNRSYLAVYSPLKDVNNSVIGMLFIGQPRVTLLATIAQSIELTFVVAIGLILVLIAPAYLMARRIARQVG